MKKGGRGTTKGYPGLQKSPPMDLRDYGLGNGQLSGYIEKLSKSTLLNLIRTSERSGSWSGSDGDLSPTSFE